MELNDAQLIQRILQGDQEAFGPLVKKYQKGVHTLVWRKIGDFHIAQEITQDAFLNAYRKLHTLKNRYQFPGWLYVIASNLCRDWLRRNRLPIESLDADNTNKVDKVSYSKYVTETQEAEADETRREIVEKLLKKLPESERTVMMLHYLGEMTIKSISEFLGVSQNTVKSRLSRARNRLKKEENVIQQNLGSFQLPDNLTADIMQEVSRITPVTPTVSKPVVPWVFSAASVFLIFILIGVDTQYLSRFQKPYNLNATAEPTVEIIDAVFVYDSLAKPAVRNQVGSSDVRGKSSTPSQQSDESLFATLPIDTPEVSTLKTQWTQTKGPEGGDVQNLFVASNGDLYARTGTDLYRLADNGRRWNLINSKLPFKGVCQVAEHDDTIYIVSDTEVLASTDRGVTWNTLSTRPQGELIGIVITNKVFYLGLVNGVYHSVDAGRSWMSLNDTNLRNKKIRAITAIENTIFVGTDSGLYRYNSEGWEHIMIGVSENIRALASSKHRLYVAVGKEVKHQTISRYILMHSTRDTSLSLYRSTDFGDSWQPLDFVITVPSGGNGLTIHNRPAGSETEIASITKMVAAQESLLVMDSGNSYYSSDAGETWKILNSKKSSDVEYVSTLVSLNANIFYRAGQSGIYRTTDAGKTWHQFNTGMVRTTVMSLVSLHNTLYANIGHALVTSSDGGESWIPVLGYSGNLRDLVKFKEAIYARGIKEIFPQLFRMSVADEGLTPVPGMPIMTKPDIKGLFATAQDVGEKNIGEDKKINLKNFDVDTSSTDYIVNVKESVANLIQSLFGSFAVSDTAYYMEYQQKLFRWKPGTTEWYDTGLVDDSEFTFSLNSHSDFPSTGFKLAVLGKTVYVGKRDGHLFQSFDEGDTWNNVTMSLPFTVEHFNVIAFAGQTLYIATDKGVAYSSDGIHWQATTDMEGTPLVIERFAVDGTMVYGISEQQIYQLKENTSKWEQVSPEIPGTITALTFDGSVLYVGTAGRGVLRFTLDESP